MDRTTEVRVNPSLEASVNLQPITACYNKRLLRVSRWFVTRRPGSEMAPGKLFEYSLYKGVDVAITGDIVRRLQQSEAASKDLKSDC